MAKFIFNDEMLYDSVYCPTHVVSKDSKVIPVFLGAPQTMNARGLIGIYVRDEDYDKIDHEKSYIFIHNPDATDDEIVEIRWDELLDKTHLHIWK